MTAAGRGWIVHNPGGSRRVVVTKELPGRRWLELLAAAGCEVAVCTSTDVLPADEIVEAFGERCDGAIGQLTERWDTGLFAALAAAGGKAYSNYAVGYDNVDVAGATGAGIPVGNTPGVLTETTAEMAAALTLAAGRRVVEADRFTRSGRFTGWLPTMFLGQRFHGGTVGIVGCGRIGAAFGRIMVEGFKMSLVYHDPYRNERLEAFVHDYSELLVAHGEQPLTATRADTVEDVLRAADVVSLHTVLDETTRHVIDAERLALMKPDAILVNTSRGPVIDEAALVAHCRAHPEFRVGLDVFEHEPALAPGLAELDNVTIVPHIASATTWTREGMATLAAANVAAILQGHPVWRGGDVLPFLEGDVPPYAPSIVNAAELGLA
jgi:hydroxypyruvate reductase 1